MCLCVWDKVSDSRHESGLLSSCVILGFLLLDQWRPLSPLARKRVASIRDVSNGEYRQWVLTLKTAWLCRAVKLLCKGHLSSDSRGQGRDPNEGHYRLCFVYTDNNFPLVFNSKEIINQQYKSLYTARFLLCSCNFEKMSSHFSILKRGQCQNTNVSVNSEPFLWSCSQEEQWRLILSQRSSVMRKVSMKTDDSLWFDCNPWVVVLLSSSCLKLITFPIWLSHLHITLIALNGLHRKCLVAQITS